MREALMDFLAVSFVSALVAALLVSLAAFVVPTIRYLQKEWRR